VVATLTPGVRGAYAATGTVNVGGDYSAYCYMAAKSSHGGVSSATPAVYDYDSHGGEYRDIPLTMTGVFFLNPTSTLETVCFASLGSDTTYGNEITAVKVDAGNDTGAIVRTHNHVQPAVTPRTQRDKAREIARADKIKPGANTRWLNKATVNARRPREK
jgi:hypothetical protein